MTSEIKIQNLVKRIVSRWNHSFYLSCNSWKMYRFFSPVLVFHYPLSPQGLWGPDPWGTSRVHWHDPRCTGRSYQGPGISTVTGHHPPVRTDEQWGVGLLSNVYSTGPYLWSRDTFCRPFVRTQSIWGLSVLQSRELLYPRITQLLYSCIVGKCFLYTY